MGGGGEFPFASFRNGGRPAFIGIGYPKGRSAGFRGRNIGHVLVTAEELILAGHSVGTSVGGSA